MERTQIYLTDKEKQAVRSIAGPLGTTQSAVIRTAIDRFIDRDGTGNKLDLLRSGPGLWSDRQDLPDFDVVRREMDRTASGSGES